MKKAAIYSFSLPAILAVVLSTLSIGSAKAQTYKVGTNVIGVGIGTATDLVEYPHSFASPMFALQYERGIWNAGQGVISLGAYFGIKSYEYSPIKGDENKMTHTTLGLKAAYHFTGWDIPNLDPYAGLMLSNDHNSVTVDSQFNSGLSGNDVRVNAFAGARYFVQPHLGVFAELSTDPYHHIDLGLAIKF
jgi:hypothetical protein